MFNAIRMRIGTLLNKPNLYEQVIYTTTTTGTIMGGIIFATETHKYSSMNDKITNCIIGSFAGGVSGLMVGLGSPVILPVTVVGGTIGIVKIGYDKIAKM